MIENKRNAYGWGANSYGQLGVGYIKEYVEQPTKVKVIEGQLIRQIACGDSHSLFLLEEGYVYSCGNPSHGKLGVGDI